MNKCKGCEWYGKPYWSIINPCDNCPRENTNVEIFTRWVDPTIEELKNQLQQKENIIKEAREYNEQIIKDIKDFYRPTDDILYSGDSLIDIATQNLEILDKGNNNEEDK